MIATSHSEPECIEVHASISAKQLLEEAANVAHKDVGVFLLDAGIFVASQTLADRTRVVLNSEQWAAFQAALDRPVSDKRQLAKLLTEPGLLD